MRAAGELADWWDEQRRVSSKALERFVDDNPNLFGVVVATFVETAMEVGSGTVDALRFGEGMAEGGLSGVGKDALRLIGLAGPLGKGAKLVHSARNAKLARLIVDPGGPICGWVTGTKALTQVGTRTFASVDDLAKALNKPLSALKGATMSEIVAALQSLGAKIQRLGNPRTLADVQRAIPRDGSVMIVGITWPHKVLKQPAGHAVYMFYDHMGRFRIADRTGNVVSSFDELGRLVPGYGGIEAAVPETMSLMRNVFMKYVGPKGIATLAMEMLAAVEGDPETVAQAYEVRQNPPAVPPPAAAPAAGAHSSAAAAAPAPRPGSAAALRLHTVVRGESLSKIANNYYANPFKWPVIYEANRKVIGPDPNLIKPGQQLYIPKLPPVALKKSAGR